MPSDKFSHPRPIGPMPAQYSKSYPALDKIFAAAPGGELKVRCDEKDDFVFLRLQLRIIGSGDGY